MIRLTASLLVAATLAACGVAGSPTAPKSPTVSGRTSIGMNSNYGMTTSTEIGIAVPLN